MAPNRDGGGTGDVGEQGGPESGFRDRNSPQGSMPVLSTPKRSEKTPYVEGSGPLTGSSSLTRRITRSMTKAEPGTTFSVAARSSARLQERLRNSATATPTTRSSTRVSSLENAPSINYHGKGSQGNDVGDEQSRATIVALRPTRPQPVGEHHPQGLKRPASSRGMGRSKTAKESTRDSTPSDAISNGEGETERARKKRKLDAKPRKLPLRRSARLAKPLTSFHKFPELPPELQMMVWDAAINPRLVYLRNMLTHPIIPFPRIQNKVPSWFMTCKLSLKIALQNYQNIFPTPSRGGTVFRQPINLDTDIVLLEPCCNGCRSRYCASRNFALEDRAAVRRLAVQTDSPFLPPSAPPCWITISDIWPNVETIYLLRTAVKGDDIREKAMIRIEEGPHEENLRKDFVEWKKGPGLINTLKCIEFVAVVEKENVPLLKDRYKSVEERKTDLVDDVILG